jgi:hypothetical protein
MSITLRDSVKRGLFSPGFESKLSGQRLCGGCVGRGREGPLAGAGRGQVTWAAIGDGRQQHVLEMGVHQYEERQKMPANAGMGALATITHNITLDATVARRLWATGALFTPMVACVHARLGEGATGPRGRVGEREIYQGQPARQKRCLV